MSREHEAEIEVATGGDELAAVRELVLRAHPDVVPELVAGSNVGELVASVEAARAAYRRVAETVGAPGPPRVPAGDTPRVAVDVELLPAAEKIRRGLGSRR
ncbi:MAG: hypothetical protein M3464_13770 [Chloroflexota bacterium]|nr:hypothetical protein [Chloroflexota bacterium]